MITNKPKIGMINIGQSPRPDILSTFHETWGEGAQMVERGALDGLTHEDVAHMYPEKGDDVLVIRMADGTQHLVGRDALIPRIRMCADTLASHHVDIAILLCTGHFDPFPFPGPFIIPQKIVNNTVAAVTGPGQTVGIMIPVEDQQKQMERDFVGNGINLVFAAASPHIGEHEIIEAASELKKYNLSLIVMHCFGYTHHMRDLVKEITGKPVLLSTSLVAKVTGELLL